MEEQYAINIADLTRDPIMASLLIGPVTAAHLIVRAEPNAADGHAVILECDQQRAKAILDVIRMRYDKATVRCYRQGPRGGWRRI